MVEGAGLLRTPVLRPTGRTKARSKLFQTILSNQLRWKVASNHLPLQAEASSKIWWRGLDSNQRRRSRQIYSLIPLATREPLRD